MVRGGYIRKYNKKSHIVEPKEDKVNYVQNYRTIFINKLYEVDILYKLNKKEYVRKKNELLSELIRYGTTPSLLRLGYYGNL